MTTYNVANGQTLYENGGTIYLGTAAGGLVSQGLFTGAETISVAQGGTLSNVTINTGGVLIISSAQANSEIHTTINNGGVLIDAAGNITDQITATAGAELVFGNTTSATNDKNSVTNTNSLFGGNNLGTGSIIDLGSALNTGTFATFAAAFTETSYTYAGTARLADIVLICYAAGTQILTAGGEKAIETILPGDTVTVLRNGQHVQEPVTWVGKSNVDPSRHAHAEQAAPIRVKAGALGDNLPVRDLLLSPEHCLILNDRCVPVKLLVNGASIVREAPTEPFTYYHIELEKHGILIAEGAPAESYLDTGNRAIFDNADAPKMLHPTFEVNATSERWKTDACAPLASVPDEVAPIWQSLATRAVELGMTIPMPKLIDSPDLHLMVDGKRLQPTSDRNSRYVFMVPAGAKSVTLASRFCIPADKMVPGVRDTRRLGVSVDWMAIRTTTNETIMPADHPALVSGWNDAETDGATMWRWTNGAATIPWDGIEGSAVLTIRCTPVALYPVYDEKLRLVA